MDISLVKFLQIYREKCRFISGQPTSFFQFISADDFRFLTSVATLFPILDIVFYSSFRFSFGCLFTSYNLLIFTLVKNIKY